jgi:hypothetical protein
VRCTLVKLVDQGRQGAGDWPTGVRNNRTVSGQSPAPWLVRGYVHPYHNKFPSIITIQKCLFGGQGFFKDEIGFTLVEVILGWSLGLENKFYVVCQVLGGGAGCEKDE